MSGLVIGCVVLLLAGWIAEHGWPERAEHLHAGLGVVLLLVLGLGLATGVTAS